MPHVKVKLPREVAEAIEERRDYGDTNRELLGLMFEERVRNDVEPEKIIWAWADQHREEYIQALVNGYEVEETPEERAVQWLMEQDIITRESAERLVRKIKEILEGVND